MAGFKRGYDYEQFASGIERSYRYRLDAEGEEFLQSVLETSAQRKRELARGTRVWRAQLGAQAAISEKQEDGSIDIEFPAFAPARMKPLDDSATEGRSIPRGSPFYTWQQLPRPQCVK